MNQQNLQVVNWTDIPEPVDDGTASHLTNQLMPDLALPSTRGDFVSLSKLNGWSILYFYPMTARPDTPLPVGWDDIPGARGCTPQSCAFRDRSVDLIRQGATAIYGISTQNTVYQQEAAERLHLPFPLLSDSELKLTRFLNLPTIRVAEKVLTKRLTLVLYRKRIKKVFYPVFPPDKNASDVLEFMKTFTTCAINKRLHMP